MGAKLLTAILNVLAKNPQLLEAFAEAVVSWATAAIQKAADDIKAQQAK